MQITFEHGIVFSFGILFGAALTWLWLRGKIDLAAANAQNTAELERTVLHERLHASE